MERVDLLGSNVFLPNDSCPHVVLHQDLAEAADLFKAVVVVDVVVEAVHPVLMDWQARQYGGPAGGAAADRGECSAEHCAPPCQAVQMWSFHQRISQCTNL